MLKESIFPPGAARVKQILVNGFSGRKSIVLAAKMEHLTWNNSNEFYLEGDYVNKE